jgi:hypothetical protein
MDPTAEITRIKSVTTPIKIENVLATIHHMPKRSRKAKLCSRLQFSVRGHQIQKKYIRNHKKTKTSSVPIFLMNFSISEIPALWSIQHPHPQNNRPMTNPANDITLNAKNIYDS